MSRLTEKHNDYYISKATCTDDLKLKLGQYEDIEEELGIDLITLFKALKDGIYIDLGNIVIFKIASIDLSLRLYLDKWYIAYYHPLHGGIFYLYLKDFNKTWWLEKPKEKGNG